MKHGCGFPALALAAVWCSFSGAGAQAAPRLNVLWITVEDMGPRLGCYGDSTVPTPHVDRLAREGVRFTRAFATYPFCAPSRHTLITGAYPTSTGGMHMRTLPAYEAVPPPGVRCFPEYLRAAGYYCTNNVKTDYQFTPPVTAWDESGVAAHWRRRPAPEVPFFSVFNLETTHEGGVFVERSPRVTDPGAVALPPYLPETPLVRRDLARHYDNIAAMDRQVGGILRELEEDGLLDRTAIFFFSDHGDGLPRMKRFVYDSGIRVPLLVRFPDRREAGTVRDDLVSFVDFAPTVLSMVGLAPPDGLPGRPFLGRRQAPPRRYVYAFRDRMGVTPETIRAVRDARFKYIRHYRPDLPYVGPDRYRDTAEGMQEIRRLSREGKLGPDQWQLASKTKPLEELYDTETDPHEIRNLAADPRHFEKLSELRAAHEEWTRTHGDLGRLDEKELVRRLWPPEGVQPATSEPVVRLEGGRLRIECATEGASIAYATGEQEGWRLYSGPLEIRGPARVRVLAHRIGWKPSREVPFELK